MIEVRSTRILLLNKIIALTIFYGPTQSGYDPTQSGFDQLSQQHSLASSRPIMSALHHCPGLEGINTGPVSQEDTPDGTLTQHSLLSLQTS